jgi:ClpP class serine protease
MRYERILSYVARVPWAIDPAKMSEILSVLAFRVAGHHFSAEEIQARIGGESKPAPARQQGAVAVIPIRGVIAHRMGDMDESSGGTSAERVGAMLKAVAADESIGTIVYDIDSPGGTAPREEDPDRAG